MASGHSTELKRRRVLSRMFAYLVFAAIVLATAYSAPALPAWIPHTLAALAVAGFPLALIILLASAKRTVAIESRPSETTPALQTPPPVAADRPLRLAVLPLDDAGDDPVHARFADGFTEEILNLLWGTGRVPLASQTSCFALRGKHADPKSVAERLHASHMIDGSLKRSPEKLVLEIQLRETGTGAQLWSEHYEWMPEEIFAIQEQIIRHVGSALDIELNADARRYATTADPQAYEAYLTGRGYFLKGALADLAHAVMLFSQATESDPQFVRAWVDLAETYALQVIYFEGSDAERKAAHVASEKALALAPDRGDVHAARGITHLASEEYEDAVTECDRAIELDPTLWKAYYNYARASYHQGQMERAVELFKKAASVNPGDYQSLLLAAPIYKRMGDEEAFEKVAREGVTRAESYLADYPDNHRAYYLGAGALLGLGERDRAFEWAERALAIDPSDPSIRYNMGCFYAKAGENDKAFECLHDSITSRSWIENDPDLDPIREDPRFQRLLDSLE